MKRFLLVIACVAVLGATGCDERHKAKIYKTKKHHVVMKDDHGKWFEYTLKGLDIDFDIPWNSRGEMVLPRGGSWRAATLEEEEEVTVEGQATNEEDTSVAEGDDGAPDGAGDVGGDDGGAGDGGDGGGDGGDGGGDGGE
jgi:hypothetical protein